MLDWECARSSGVDDTVLDKAITKLAKVVASD